MITGMKEILLHGLMWVIAFFSDITIDIHSWSNLYWCSIYWHGHFTHPQRCGKFNVHLHACHSNLQTKSYYLNSFYFRTIFFLSHDLVTKILLINLVLTSSKQMFAKGTTCNYLNLKIRLTEFIFYVRLYRSCIILFSVHKYTSWSFKSKQKCGNKLITKNYFYE